jgi:hypothetical protein
MCARKPWWAASRAHRQKDIVTIVSDLTGKSRKKCRTGKKRRTGENGKKRSRGSITPLSPLLQHTLLAHVLGGDLVPDRQRSRAY